MSDRRFSFTKSNLNKLEIPAAGKRVYYYDTKVNGLGIAVTGVGTKTFVVYRKIQSKPERITLGRYPDISLDEARAQAHEINAAIARGENPNEKKRQARTEWTLKVFFELYLTQYAKAHKRTWAEDQAQFERYLKHWHSRKLSSLHKTDIQALHIELGEQHGHYAANRLLSLLQTVFNKAQEWGWENQNPAKGIRKFPERARERFLLAEELPRFFQALEAETNLMIKDYVWLSLLTGARKSNVLSMRWSELDLNQAIWHISMTKNGTSQNIPLMSEAIDILNTRRTQLPHAEFVFPSRSKTGHVLEPKNAWKKLLLRADINNLRLHDLRRSLGSWQAATGASLPIIGKTLNHKSASATEIYARLDLAPVRQAMEIATRAILKAGKTA